jgi:hypothetical protein
VTGVHIVALLGGAAILIGMFELLRRGQLREKYAVLWLLVGIVVAVFGAFPSLLDHIAQPLHIADAPNLLFFAGDVVLLLVTVHLSWESSRMEDRTRALAEEVALLREQIEQH